MCSLLSGRPIRVGRIREGAERPGLHDFEASLLRLVDKLTNGTAVEINETGTTLRFRPGVLQGGQGVVHDCGCSRGIGWFLEPLLVLALFAKRPVQVTLRGVTNDDLDPTVDCFKAATLPLLEHFGLEGGWDLRVVKRGFKPEGGGEVVFKCPVAKRLQAARIVDEGIVRRIRGTAYSCLTAPQNTNRMVDGARGVFNQLLSDVYTFTDHMSGPKAGNSPGYGVSLVAETTTGLRFSVDRATGPATSVDKPTVPEDLGEEAAKYLLEEISKGGIVDSHHQGLLLLLCALGEDTLHQVRLGPLTPYAIHVLRHIKDFFGTVFNLAPEQQSKTIFASCVGSNVRNLAKGVR